MKKKKKTIKFFAMNFNFLMINFDKVFFIIIIKRGVNSNVRLHSERNYQTTLTTLNTLLYTYTPYKYIEFIFIN